MKKTSFLFSFLMLFFVSLAEAHFEVLNTADVLSEGRSRAILSPQLMFGDLDGLNVSGAFDFGYSQDSDVRINVGVGQVDFNFAGHYKWAPIPDVDKQPAFGIIFSTLYAHIDGGNEFSVRAAPVISKKFNSVQGVFNPYISLPVALTARSGDEEFPVHLVFGTEWKPANIDQPWSFIGEIGFNIDDSFSHITLGWIFEFDGVPSINIRTSEQRSSSDSSTPNEQPATYPTSSEENLQEE